MRQQIFLLRDYGVEYWKWKVHSKKYPNFILYRSREEVVGNQ